MSPSQSVIGVVTLLAVTLGCAHRPALSSYRLLRENRVPVMLPPGVTGPELARPTFLADVPVTLESCILDDAVQLRSYKKRFLVTVNRDALLARPPGWLADWGVRAEARGCIAPGFGHALALRIIESVPLNPTAAYRLLHASSSVTGFVDLGPENRLEVFSPILREERRSAALDWTIDKISGQGYQLNVDLKPDFTVIGFERAWYAVRRKRGHLGYVIMPLSATRNIQGTVQEMPHPETNYFLFQEEPAFFRLFLKRDANGVVAIVTFAPTPEELDRRTAIVANDSGACERMQEICRTLPRSLGVNPYTAAIVNGREVNVPIGGTVSTAIQAAGVKNSSVLLPRLKVSRFFGNKLVPIIFDHNSEDILNIPLTGRERISW